MYGVLLFPLVPVFFRDRKNEDLLIFNYVFIKSRVRKQSEYYYCGYDGIFFFLFKAFSSLSRENNIMEYMY